MFQFLDYNMQLGTHFSTCENLCSKEIVATSEKKRSAVATKVAKVVERNIIVKYLKGIQKVSHFKVSKAVRM